MRIVVGVDGSPESTRAVTWAAEEARAHGWEVEVVHAEIMWARTLLDETRDRAVRERILANTRAVTEDAESAVRAVGVPVTTHTARGEPVQLLLERAEHAAMLVVGGHGGGGFRGMLLGSVAHAVTGRAACPVAVVRERVTLPGKEIVVGVGEGDVNALRYALGEAEAHGAHLTAVRVWRPPHVASPMGLPDHSEDVATVQEAERRNLHAAVAGVVAAGRSEQVVTERLVSGHPVRVLSDLSASADLVVVGSRGRSGYALGSVSHGLIHHATGPVVVVPNR